MTKFTNIKENLIFNFKALLSSFKILLTNGDSKLFTKNTVQRFLFLLKNFFLIQHHSLKHFFVCVRSSHMMSL